jgi:hypothetical protein
MKKVCRLLFFVLLPTLTEAQYERILNNPDVIWAAEIDVTYYLRPPLPSDSVQYNDIIFWKNFDPKNRVLYEGSELLIEKILAAARSGEWPAWQFADTVRQLSVYEVSRRLDSHDTIVTVDVGTGEHEVKAVISECDPASFFAVRAKQLLYFDEKKGDFELLTYAVAPVRRVSRDILNKSGEWKEIHLFDYVPFWLKMPDFSKKKSRKQPNLHDSNISWAAQIKTLGNSPELENLRPFKDFKRPVMQVLLDRFRTDAKFEVYDTADEPISFEARRDMLFSVDTLLTFDLETYEEKIEIEKNEIRAKDVPRLRLIQNWYWDDKQRRLVIHFQSFAPMLAVLDYMDNLRFYKSLFYRRKK